MLNRNIKLVFADTFLSAFSLYISFLLRFEFAISDFFMNIFISWLPWFVMVQIIVFHFMRMYDRIWRYTSLFDLYAIITAVALSSGAAILCIFLGGVTNEAYPRSVLIPRTSRAGTISFGRTVYMKLKVLELLPLTYSANPFGCCNH